MDDSRPEVVAQTGDVEDAGRTIAHYDRIAAEYDRQVDGVAVNRVAREAFRERVSALAGMGGRILDYGCGTGIDAAWYAARGHRVIAYDPSSRMVEVLRARCADAIADGRIRVLDGQRSALASALAATQPLDAIAANFGVLNHVRDLTPVLHSLANHLRAGGSLVASLLNPLQRGPIRTWRWQREALRSLRTGSIVHRGQVTTYRHHVWAVARAARPTLEMVEVAYPTVERGWTPGRPRPRRLLRQEFLFVVLRKVP